VIGLSMVGNDRRGNQSQIHSNLEQISCSAAQFRLRVPTSITACTIAFSTAAREAGILMQVHLVLWRHQLTAMNAAGYRST
jgi:hypothetical protein